MTDTKLPPLNAAIEAAAKVISGSPFPSDRSRKKAKAVLEGAFPFLGDYASGYWEGFEEGQAAMRDEFAKLQTPAGVLVNMLRGSIARPELRTVLHAYGMLAEYDARAEALKVARDGLERAAGWFRGYGEGHAKKGDGDKDQRNFDRAIACDSAIAKIDALQAEALK